ncbi:MAG: hypothetical protein ABIS28_07520 [Caldimonas sp.]
MAQQGSNPSNRGSSQEDHASRQHGDVDRSRREQVGAGPGPGQDQRSAYSERSPQMGDIHTGSVRSFYHPWRQEQARDLDDDYADWRRDRYKKFSDEFDAWRRGRSNHGGAAAPDATSGPGTPSSESGSASSGMTGSGSTASPDGSASGKGASSGSASHGDADTGSSQGRSK